MVDFLIIGPYNAITYNEVFPLFKDDVISLGVSRRGMSFINNDVKINSRWFSNLVHPEPGPLTLKKGGEYRKFDNYDVINIDRISDIPSDYDGLMGVPVSFLDVWNPEQFELIGFPGIGIVPEGWKGMTEDFIKLYYEQGNTGCYEVGKKMGYFVKDGKAIIPYVRLLIKKKIS